MNKGFIIEIEGADGVGKTTFCNNMKELFEKDNNKVKIVKFPSEDNYIGKYIRETLLSKEMLCPLNIFQNLYFLEQLSKKSQLEELVNDGYIVLLDRYETSTLIFSLAYEKVYGVNMSIKELINLQRLLLKPDVKILLTAPKNVIKQRIINSNKKDFHESNVELQNVITDEYMNLATTNYISDNWNIISTESPIKIQYNALSCIIGMNRLFNKEKFKFI